MKRVLGGSGYTNCSTTCSDGTVLEITDCNGRCIAEDGVAVTCEGNSYNLTKSCKDSGSGATTSGIF